MNSTKLCVVCGKPIAGRSPMFCSQNCRKKALYRSSECRHNKSLICHEGDCNRCGWNPEVEKRRLKALEEQYGKRSV